MWLCLEAARVWRKQQPNYKPAAFQRHKFLKHHIIIYILWLSVCSVLDHLREMTFANKLNRHACNKWVNRSIGAPYGKSQLLFVSPCWTGISAELGTNQSHKNICGIFTESSRSPHRDGALEGILKLSGRVDGLHSSLLSETPALHGTATSKSITCFDRLRARGGWGMLHVYSTAMATRSIIDCLSCFPSGIIS